MGLKVVVSFKFYSFSYCTKDTSKVIKRYTFRSNSNQSQLKRCKYLIYASFLELEFFVVQIDSKGTGIHVFQLRELLLHPDFSISIVFYFIIFKCGST